MHHEVGPPTAHGLVHARQHGGRQHGTEEPGEGEGRQLLAKQMRAARVGLAELLPTLFKVRPGHEQVEARPLQRRQGVGGGHPGDLMAARPQGHGQGPEWQHAAQAPVVQKRTRILPGTARSVGSELVLVDHRSPRRELPRNECGQVLGEAASAASMRRSNSARSSGRATTAAIRWPGVCGSLAAPWLQRRGPARWALPRRASPPRPSSAPRAARHCAPPPAWPGCAGRPPWPAVATAPTART